MSPLSSGTHRIDCLRLRLHCPGVIGDAVQQRASRLFHRRLRDALARVIEHAWQAGDGRAQRIERLTVDVGDMALAQFDEQFVGRVAEALGLRLRTLLSGAGKATSQAQSAQAMIQPTAQPTAQPTPAAAADEALAVLLHYLQSGVLLQPSWWQAQSPGRWLQAQLLAPSTPLAAWRDALAVCCLQAAPLRRLATTFGDAALRALHALLASAAPALPAAVDWPPYLLAAALLARSRDPGAVALPALPPAGVAVPLQTDAAAYWRHVAGCLAGQSWPRTWQPLMAGLTLPGSVSTTPVFATTPLTASAEALPPPSAAALLRASTALVVAASAASVDVLPVSNAGLVLLWPLLPGLLRRLGLLREAQFADPAAQQRAVCCLDWLLWESGADALDRDVDAGSASACAWRAPLTRLLCGLSPTPDESEAPAHWERPADAQQEILRAWLDTALSHWQDLERCSTQDFLSLFLQRPGVLSVQAGHWQLTVEREAGDVLLGSPPWPLGEIRLPWLERPLRVAWLTP